MALIENMKTYPWVLWALALYLASLGFDLRLDIPLAIFAVVGVYALLNNDYENTVKQVILQCWPVLFFLVVTLIVTITSKDIQHSLGVQIQFLPAILIYCVITVFAREKRLLEFVVIAFVLAACIAGITLLVRLLLNDLTDPMEKVITLRSSLFTVPNDVLYLSVVTPLALALGISDSRWMIRVMVGLYLLVTFLLAVYLQSRQAVGVFVLSIGFLVFLHNLRRGLWIGLFLLVAAVLVDWLLGKGLASKLVLFFPRQYVWDAAWQMFLERPITGFGPGLFKDNYFEYLEKAGYATVEDHRPMKWAHSLYFEQLAERGALGLLALLVMLGAAIKGLIRSGGELGQSWLAKGVLSGFMALLLAGVAEASLLRLWTVTLLFVLVAIASRIKISECYFK